MSEEVFGLLGTNPLMDIALELEVCLYNHLRSNGIKYK